MRNPIPHNTAVLLMPEFSNLTLGSVIEPLRVVNRVLQTQQYKWILMAITGDKVRSSSGISVQVEECINTIGKFDTLFFLASDNAEKYYTKELAQFLRQTFRKNIPITAFDSAPLLTARAGLLDGRSATTHWEDLEQFAFRFSKIHVVSDRFVMNDTISTTSGSLASFDYVLDMIGQRDGLAMALTVSGLFNYQATDDGKGPQHMVAMSRLSRMDPKLTNVIRSMEENIDHPISIAQICADSYLSQREVERRFRRVLNTTPKRFYLSLRLNLARRLLETTTKRLVDISVTVGFGSRSAFTRAFSEHFGFPPSYVRTDTSKPKC